MTDRDSELIEIMARAYAERNDFDWESPGHGQIYYLGRARAALSALREAGYEITPRELTNEMREAGRAQMPAEARYWQEGGVIHAKHLPPSECVPVDNVWRAILAASHLPAPPHTERDDG